MKPYYESGGITIYHGDCREILPALEKVDLVLTDPPYGIGRLWSEGSPKHGWSKSNQTKDERNVWDAEAPSQETLDLVRAAGKTQIIWGGNYFQLPPSRCWLVWNKPERGFSLAEAELAWTNMDAVVRVFDFRRSDPGREHPTQKPLELMQWCIARVGEERSRTIVDPFMGSGTTLRAAKDFGRTAIGIELEEKYCEIAVRRLAQECLFSGA